MADLGLALQPADSFCYSPQLELDSCVHRPSQFPVGSASTQDGRTGKGIMVGGVPVGDAIFVEVRLAAKADKALSKITTLSSKLRTVHQQSLFTVLR